MGLDMYLEAELYVGGWRHTKPDEKKLFDALSQLTGITPHDGAPSFNITAHVGYWRKANAIHAWFVEIVQEGNDECQRSCVSREQLIRLRESCKQVLDTVETVPGKISEGSTYHGDGTVEHHSRTGEVIAQEGIAQVVLPTKSGFFFGSTNYDENYLQDLRDTVKIIDDALSSPALLNCSFYYQASW